jgi:hypothetical protein
MNKPYTVFYGNQVYGEYFHWKDFRLDTLGPEVYNGGLYFNSHEREWFNLDGTPVLLEDVPKLLRMLALVLNL